MRGKVGLLHGDIVAVRITPAYAGKRPKSFTDDRRCGDHPRVCGEKSFKTSISCGYRGSPPRMRGKATLPLPGVRRRRITPAYAGKRGWMRATEITRKDHPRVCGEKAACCRCPAWLPGSPPRMRGKGGAQRTTSHYKGITPAYAGKRLKRSHSIGHFSCILCLFHSVLHRASVSDGSRAGPCAPPCLPAQNAVPV